MVSERRVEIFDASNMPDDVCATTHSRLPSRTLATGGSAIVGLSSTATATTISTARGIGFGVAATGTAG